MNTCFFSQGKKEIFLVVCIDGIDKLHVKAGKMYWEHIGAIPPGLHYSCLDTTKVNNSKWEDWKSTFDLGFNTDSLIKSTIIKKYGPSELVQSPSKKNNWETIWLFSDPGSGPNNFAISLIYLQPKGGFIPNNISFGIKNSILTPQSKIELDSISKAIIKSKREIEISGHTDNSGKTEDNLKLSEERAKAVYNYLLSKGVDALKMTYKGFGDTKPISPNDNEINKAKNRRVEIKIIS